jgi:chaperone modulatory protein CbpM
MQTKKMISAHEFCIHHNVKLSFVQSLNEFGLIEVVTIDGKIFLLNEQLSQIEKLTRFYFDMGINLEGIETISHLLHRILIQQQQIIELTNKLRIYEDE